MSWVLRISGFVIALMMGIYIGIHMAEKNMHHMQGTEGAPKAIQITPGKDGKIEISVLGQVVETKKPGEKYQQQVIELKNQVTEGTNQWSDLGNYIGHEVRETARGLLGWMFAWISSYTP